MSRVFLTLLVGVEQHGFARARAADHAQYLAAADLEIELIVDDLGSERRAQPPDAEWRGVGAGAAPRSRTMKVTAKTASHNTVMQVEWTPGDEPCRPRLWTPAPTNSPWRH